MHSLSELIPVSSRLADGEFQFDGTFALRQMHAARFGDLHRGDLELESEFGHAQYTMLGREHYAVDWATYAFRGGLSYTATIAQPFVELHFQLQGSAQGVHSDVQNIEVTLQEGDTNATFMPATHGSFSLSRDSAGSVFEVLLSADYFQGLAERYPHLLGKYLERMLRQEPFLLSNEHLRITPVMRGIIHRIRQRTEGHAAGSLFLEAQILELLSLQLEQAGQPARRNGHTLSRADLERMHAARDILLARIIDPPSLGELARQVGTNEFKLKRGFREVFGTSPYAFLLDHRLETARAFLLDTDLTVAEIAYRIGYRDPAHLTHAFRKKYSIRPSDLR